MKIVGVEQLHGGMPDPNAGFWGITVEDDVATVEASNYFYEGAKQTNIEFKDGDLVVVHYGFNAQGSPKKIAGTQLYALDYEYDEHGVVTQTVHKAFDTASPSPIVKSGIQAFKGGGTSLVITVANMKASDIALVTLQAATNADATLTWAVADGKITVTFSKDPGANTQVSYLVMRP